MYFDFPTAHLDFPTADFDFPTADFDFPTVYLILLYHSNRKGPSNFTQGSKIEPYQSFFGIEKLNQSAIIFDRL